MPPEEAAAQQQEQQRRASACNLTSPLKSEPAGEYDQKLVFPIRAYRRHPSSVVVCRSRTE